MTRMFDFTVLTVIYIISTVIHLIAVELMAPGTPLYGIATEGTAVMNGQEWADFAFMALSTWVPLIAVGGITAWALIREYRRVTATAVRRP